MEIVVGNICDQSGTNAVINGFLELRREVFINKMDWQLFSHAQIEYEQYDAITTTYVIAHEGGQVVGGARLIRTDNRLPTAYDARTHYSYMIRDAYLGLLPGLPTDICDVEPPVSNSVWELTRFISMDGVRIGAEVLTKVNTFLGAQNAKSCLFLGPPAFMRMSKSMGYKPKPLGKIVGNTSGRFLAFSCDVI